MDWLALRDFYAGKVYHLVDAYELVRWEEKRAGGGGEEVGGRGLHIYISTYISTHIST